MKLADLPRWERKILAAILPRDWRNDILRDLEEAWTAQRARGGLRSRIWLWGQCLGFGVRFLPVRAVEAIREAVTGSTDLKLALRSVARAPLVGVLTVVSLGVGIGAAVTGYTVVEGAFFTDLPFDGGDRIVLVEDYDPVSRSSLEVGPDEFLRRRARLESFEYLEAYQQRSVVMGSDGGRAEVMTALFTTPDFLRMTGVRPLLGRLPVAGDAVPGAEPVVVLPHSVWVNATGGTPDVVGTRLEVAGARRTVIGVMPEAFGFPYDGDLWLPFDVRDADGTLRMVGKLKEGVGLAAARAEMAITAQRDPMQAGDRVRAGDRAQPGVGGRSPQGSQIEHLVTGITRPLADEREVVVLAVPIAILVLILVVMATNVANLILARNAMRARELAVRSALGASRTRLVGQLAAEVALTAFVASALGLWLSQVAIGIVDARIRFPFWVDFSVDPGTVAFAVGLGALVTLIAGVAPAVKATTGSADDALRGVGSGVSAVRFGRLTGALVVLQLTVCVGFLSTATLLGQSLLTYDWDRYGLPAEATLVAQLYFGYPESLSDPASELDQAERRLTVDAFMREATRKLEEIRDQAMSIPGIRATAAASRFPGNESEKAYVVVEHTDAAARVAEVAEVGPDYFDLLGTAPIRGRALHAGDRDVAVVNEPFVRERLPGMDPIGRRIRLTSPGAGPDGDGSWRTIVGVVPDLGLNPGDPGNAAGVYLPLGDTNILRLALRGDGDPGAWEPRLVEIARRVDPEIEVQWSRTLADQMAEPVMIFQGLGIALLTLGGLALLLSAASIHALTGYTVTRRTRELGIRQALGADAASVVRVVVTRAAAQLALGTLLGTGLAAALLRMSTVMPWEVRQSNPAALVVVGAALLVSGGVALARPLVRALSIRPADAMRIE